VNTTTSQVSGSARRQADLTNLIRMALRREGWERGGDDYMTG
jgi:hypothetical protein